MGRPNKCPIKLFTNLILLQINHHLIIKTVCFSNWNLALANQFVHKCVTQPSIAIAGLVGGMCYVYTKVFVYAGVGRDKATHKAIQRTILDATKDQFARLCVAKLTNKDTVIRCKYHINEVNQFLRMCACNLLKRPPNVHFWLPTKTRDHHWRSRTDAIYSEVYSAAGGRKKSLPLPWAC